MREFRTTIQPQVTKNHILETTFIKKKSLIMAGFLPITLILIFGTILMIDSAYGSYICFLRRLRILKSLPRAIAKIMKSK